MGRSCSLYNFLETEEDKQILSDTLADLAEIVLKNNIFEFGETKTWNRHWNEVCALCYSFYG